MGASAKRKREKAQDFKKTKLRVGKTAAKPSNHTSTSFRSKSIALTTQSLNLTAPSLNAKIAHYLSLLSHHSNITRRESLQYLISHPPPATTLPKLLAHITDESKSCRNELLKLLGGHAAAGAVGEWPGYPTQDVMAHLPLLRLYVFSGMTHIEEPIRKDAVRFLDWALKCVGHEMVMEGGWRRGLRDFVGILENGDGVESLVRFLNVGVGGGEEEEKEEGRRVVDGLHWSAVCQVSRVGARGFVSMGLFAECEEGGEDEEGRRRWLQTPEGKEVVANLEKALKGLMKDAGEKGRVAGRAMVVLQAAASA